MISKLRELGARLDRLLTGANFDVVGKTPLFRLARHDDAARWFERLARAGILTRPFLGRPVWLRFGLPVEEADWQRLATALAAN
jgi:cobalamin biosynthetic protein CobC